MSAFTALRDSVVTAGTQYAARQVSPEFADRLLPTAQRPSLPPATAPAQRETQAPSTAPNDRLGGPGLVARVVSFVQTPQGIAVAAACAVAGYYLVRRFIR